MKKPKNMPYMTQNGEDRENNPNQYICSMKNDCTAGYKYFKFNKVSSISVKVLGVADGELRVQLSEKGKAISIIKLTSCGEGSRKFTSEFNVTQSTHSLYFVYNGNQRLE
ncbi:hypothetical protein IAI10_24215 [Clostridium sp. 19966]|uniref:hypothetical protein n=1 Tax=Clostridium sp. 19966 TaxID=2768166 RepID=UPI0028DF5FE6|nr:hypothetical protein [Clostridium sp. 19966]MDT8719738.1 hypothetical protein [Clostridium sp. 19966]